MTLLSLFLVWLTHHSCTVWVPGHYPWKLGGIHIAYGGGCVEAFNVARQLPGAILSTAQS